MTELYALIVILIAGRSLLSNRYVNVDERPLPVCLSYYFFAGSIVLSLYMFLLSLVGIRFSVFAVSLPFIVFIIYDIYRSRPVIRLQMPQIRKPDPEAFLFAAVSIILALVIISVFLNNYFLPVFRADAIAHWMFQAKIFFVERRIPLDVLLHKVYDYRADYPLLVPLNLAWIGICIGSWQDTAVRVIFSCQYLAAIIIFYDALKEYSGGLFAAMASMMIFSVPVLLAHIENGYADFTLAAFALLATIAFFNWIRKERFADLCLAALFIGGAAWTKNEGIALASSMILSLAACLFLKKKGADRSIPIFLQFALISCAVFVPFKLFAAFNHIGNHMLKSANVLGIAAQGIVRIPLISKHFGYQLFLDTYQWMYFWIYVLLFISLRKRDAVKDHLLFPLLFIVLSLISYFVLFMVTPLDLEFHLSVSLDRLLLGLSLSAAFIAFVAAFAENGKAE